MCRCLAGEVIVIRYQHIAGCQSLYSYILNAHGPERCWPSIKPLTLALAKALKVNLDPITMDTDLQALLNLHTHDTNMPFYLDMSPEVGGVLVKFEMRQMAAASHTLLNRHLGECIPPPQSLRVPLRTRLPTLQSQTVGGRWAAPKSPKYARKRSTEHKKNTKQALIPPRVRGACLAPTHAAPCAWEPLGTPGGIKMGRSATARWELPAPTR